MSAAEREGAKKPRIAPADVPRVPVIDGFRAYAILGVVAIHLIALAGALEPGTRFSLVAWGMFGNAIDTFFIISGFCIFLGVVARRGELGSIRDFGIARAARLVPAYWLSLAVLLALIALLPHPSGPVFSREPPTVTGAEVLADMAALQMPVRLFDSSFPVGFGVNGALWMISIIAGFYVVFPFIARGYYRHPLLGLAIAAAITFGWKQAALHVPGFFQWLDQGDGPLWVVQLIAGEQLPGWAFSFALGMTGAWAYVRLLEGGSLKRFERRAVFAAAAALVAFGTCAYVYAHNASTSSFGLIGGSEARSAPTLTLAYSIARAALVAAIALGPIWLRRPFDNRPTRKLAELSYGIYLIHIVVAGYLATVLLGLPDDGGPEAVALWFVVVIPASAAYAWLSVRFVERPARRWAANYAERRSAPRAPIAPPSVRPARP